MGDKSVETYCYSGVLDTNFTPQLHNFNPSPQTMLDFLTLKRGREGEGISIELE